jgi:four helix bundle protein
VVSGEWCAVEDARYKPEDFELYRAVREFRKKTYCLVKQLPPVEKYALGCQMRRAAVSVTNNIAEGYGRWYFQENIKFCRVSRGSVEELIDDFNVCIDEGYVKPNLVEDLKQDAYALVRRINGYIAYLRKTKQTGDE